MEFLLAIVESLASKAAEYTVEPTVRRLGYLFKYKTKFQDLRSKVKELEDATERVQESVDAANRDGREIFDDVQRWLTTASEKISDEAARQLQEDKEKAMKRCFAGFCPDFKSRYQLSKKADKEAIAITELLKQKFDVVSRPFVPKATDIIRPVKEYEAFDSRSKALDEVMEALKNNNVNIIGVHGMGGVGKTTLVTYVARQAEEKRSFDAVVFVRVAQTTDPELIQKQIASQLGLKLDDNQTIDVRAAHLCNRLKKAEKVLIVLDDIWKELEVETIGIPSADQHKGCKILMTSRMPGVLNLMSSQKLIPIDILDEVEAWNLFKKMAGHVTESFDVKTIAEEVAQKCAGLPLAITTVAKALRGKKLAQWKDALEQLNSSEINSEGIGGAVYKAIDTSYTYLETKERKSTFLLCGIMGHGAAIEDLLKYCRGLGLFDSLDTMEKMRNRVVSFVDDLIDSSLLLAGSTPERFGIHDVVRDVAISIASRDCCWLALGEEDVFEEWSNKDTMRNCNLVGKVSELPDGLECPNLTFFSMFGTVEVPANFFNAIQGLRVLEFGRTNFTVLPSSLVCLKTLRTLCLRNCDLEEICILGDLRNLEILDLCGSSITVLPEEIGQLTKLKLLDLKYCRNLQVISPNVLSKLSSLEELYLYDSFDGWEVDGIESPRNNASLAELQPLSRLTTLEVHIPNVKALPKDNLSLERKGRFRVSIGFFIIMV
ncbi:hypothetical protein V6N11_016517 [Hibiscus sabdariffa]|uniref:AAA+ ATPase domain-containing protein n=1 Tax=Hibiscus sabdariffa TaxID=183260 RepID=A0ABR2TVB9_9ROSI